MAKTHCLYTDFPALAEIGPEYIKLLVISQVLRITECKHTAQPRTLPLQSQTKTPLRGHASLKRAFLCTSYISRQTRIKTSKPQRSADGVVWGGQGRIHLRLTERTELYE